MKYVVVSLFLSLPVLAQTTFVVNNTADSVDASPGDGICADSSGPCGCTLRAAIIEANHHAGPDTIIIPPGAYVLTIPGTNEQFCATGDLDITDTLTIQGFGANVTKIDGNRLDTVIEVQAGPVTITGVTISGGDGGGVIHDSGALTFNDCVISGNEAAYGGGISSKNGDLNLNRTTVANNIANNNYGGVYKLFGTLNMDNSTISDNTAQLVSGLYSGGANATVANSTISGNTTSHPTGGIAAGILNDCQPAMYAVPTTMTLTNSTVSGNIASSSHGGGIYNRSDPACGAYQPVLTIISSTITENQAGGSGGGIRNGQNGVVLVKNTIVAKNIAAAGGDCSGVIFSQGSNLDSDSTCSGFSTAQPMLLPLALNAPGATRTHALSAGSPAINGAPCVVSFDQRGVPRPQPPALCDIGTYEAP